MKNSQFKIYLSSNMTNSVKIKRSLHSPTTKSYTSLHFIFFKIRPHSLSKESLSMIINFKKCREHSVASLTKIGVVFPSFIVVIFNNIKWSIISVWVPQLILCSMVFFFFVFPYLFPLSIVIQVLIFFCFSIIIFFLLAFVCLSVFL